MKFTKNDTLCMKGIAILIMFFHHNYLGPDRWLDSPISFYPFSESQVVYIAKFFKICVGMFVFLTGYGMMASAKEKIKDNLAMRRYVVNRYLSMMLGFWFIFLVVQIVSGIFTNRFTVIYGKGMYAWIYFFIDGMGLAHLFSTPTFCATWWYMSLAIFLILLFPFFKRIIENYHEVALILTVLLPTALKLPYSDFWRWIFCYSLGIYFAKHDIFTRLKEWYDSLKRIAQIGSFICMTICMPVIVLLRQSTGFGVKFLYFWEGVAPMYLILYIYLFFTWCRPLMAFLRFLGKHSMNMFLIHTMFRAIYFHDFIYSFYYIWLDYIVLIIVSLAASIIIEFLKKLIHFHNISNTIKNVIQEKIKFVECS